LSDSFLDLCLQQNYEELKKEIISHAFEQLVCNLVTNFIWLYLYQFFDDFYGFDGAGKPLERPSTRY